MTPPLSSICLSYELCWVIHTRSGAFLRSYPGGQADLGGSCCGSPVVNRANDQAPRSWQTGEAQLFQGCFLPPSFVRSPFLPCCPPQVTLMLFLAHSLISHFLHVSEGRNMSHLSSPSHPQGHRAHLLRILPCQTQWMGSLL